MTRRCVVLLIGALLALPAAATAKAPRITGTFSLPKGLVPGGFVIHGFVAGPGNTVWLTTETATGATAKPPLVRVSASGKTTSVKIAAPGGMVFTGVGLGPGNRIWFSGYGGAAGHKGVSGTVSGTTAHFVVAKDSGSWDQLAVVKGTAYLTDGFNDLSTSTDGTTFTRVLLGNVNPFDIAPFGTGLAVAGDGAIGFLDPGSLAPPPAMAMATLLTTTSGTVPGSRYETVAGGKLWFLQQGPGGGITGLGVAGADGVASIHAMPSARQITTGPDGAPWVLTASKAERIGPSGSVSASVKLPGGQRGILIAGATSKYVWVATLTSSGAGKLVRITVK